MVKGLTNVEVRSQKLFHSLFLYLWTLPKLGSCINKLRATCTCYVYGVLCWNSQMWKPLDDQIRRVSSCLEDVLNAWFVPHSPRHRRMRHLFIVRTGGRSVTDPSSFISRQSRQMIFRWMFVRFLCHLTNARAHLKVRHTNDHKIHGMSKTITNCQCHDWSIIAVVKSQPPQNVAVVSGRRMPRSLSAFSDRHVS